MIVIYPVALTISLPSYHVQHFLDNVTCFAYDEASRSLRTMSELSQSTAMMALTETAKQPYTNMTN